MKRDHSILEMLDTGVAVVGQGSITSLIPEKPTHAILFEAKQPYGTKPPRLMLACANINSTHSTGT